MYKHTKVYIKIYANCILVKGVSRSCIIDLQFNKLHFIPNALYTILKEFKNYSLNEIFKNFENKDEQSIIEEYLNFILEKKLGFLCTESELKSFPDLNLNWDYPSDITNAIIDIGKNSKHNIIDIISQLDESNCFHIQLRYLDVINKKEIWKMAEFIEKTSLRTLHLVLNFNMFSNENEIVAFCKKFNKIQKLEIFNSPLNKTIYVREAICTIRMFTDETFNSNSCGRIGMEYFSVVLDHFTEALKCNSCLNRKIAIDPKGFIKNCPSGNEIYGNIKNNKISKVINKEKFRKLWFINKDSIKGCMACEFRYVCTDCRAYVENPEDIYSKPLKCGYNAKTCEWSDWKILPEKQEAIKYYNL